MQNPRLGVKETCQADSMHTFFFFFFFKVNGLILHILI